MKRAASPGRGMFKGFGDTVPTSKNGLPAVTPEVRFEHLLENLPGDRAWRYDKSHYPSLNRKNQDEQER